MTNIPIYRAKKIDSDKYVYGYYFPQDYTGDFSSEDAEEREEIEKHFICGTTVHNSYDDEEGHFTFMGIDEIDPSTIAIHFPDMLASDSDRLLPNGEKDLRIFASLSEDGKGGDILSFIQTKDYSDEITRTGTVNISFNGLNGMSYSFMLNPKDRNFKNAKTIGIQQ